jgi:hypothetical protein
VAAFRSAVVIVRAYSSWKLCANVQQLIGKISPEVSASAFYLQVRMLLFFVTLSMPKYLSDGACALCCAVHLWILP